MEGSQFLSLLSATPPFKKCSISKLANTFLFALMEISTVKAKAMTRTWLQHTDKEKDTQDMVNFCYLWGSTPGLVYCCPICKPSNSKNRHFKVSRNKNVLGLCAGRIFRHIPGMPVPE